VDEVSKYIASKFARKTRNDLIDFYESVISKVSDYSVKKYLTDWFNLHYSRLMYNSGEEEYTNSIMSSCIVSACSEQQTCPIYRSNGT